MKKEEDGDFTLLLKYSENAMLFELKELFEKKQFSQEQIDEAFRICIKNFKKHNKDYEESIKLFLNQTSDINFQNDKYNETTVLMYAFDEGQEIPSDLILSCFNNEINLNLYDSFKETTLFHLIKSDKINEDCLKDFLTQLLTKNFDFDFKNNNEETISLILENKGKKHIINFIKEIIDNINLNMNKLTLKYNKSDKNENEEIIYELKKYYEQINIIQNQNNSFFYNIVFLLLLLLFFLFLLTYQYI